MVTDFFLSFTTNNAGNQHVWHGYALKRFENLEAIQQAAAEILEFLDGFEHFFFSITLK